MAWPNNTRRFWVDAGSKAKPTGGGVVTYDISKVGILAALHLAISGSIAGTLTAPNALGFSSIVKRIQLILNSGHTLYDISGSGYFYLLKDFLEHYINPVPQNTGGTAVTATTFNLDAYLPIALNARDEIGLILLQNEQTNARLTVEFEADATVATGATVTATVQPFLETFSVPRDEADWPRFDFVQSIQEESQTVSGAGDVKFSWPRGNIYLQLIHGAGIAAAAADNFSKAILRVQQNTYIVPNAIPAFLTLEYNRFHGRARTLGVIPWDLLGVSGLGDYGSLRDAIDTAGLTDVDSVVTFSAAGTLYSMKRQLIPIRPEGS